MIAPCPLRVRRLVLAMTILAAATAAEFVSQRPAMAQQATSDQCTCNTKHEKPPERGAHVENAALCVSQSDPNREWCNIYVHKLKGDPSATSLARQIIDLAQRDPTSLPAVLGFIIDQNVAVLRASTDGLPDREAMLLIEHRSALLEAIRRNLEDVAKCTRNFGASEPMQIQPRDAGPGSLGCRVSSASRWLHIDFIIARKVYTIMIAPGGSAPAG